MLGELLVSDNFFSFKYFLNVIFVGKISHIFITPIGGAPDTKGGNY